MLSKHSETPIVLSLDAAFVSHPVNTHIFAPFLVARLEEHPDTQERTLPYEIVLHNVGVHGLQSVPLILSWTEAMIPPLPLAAQREYVTEAAACGMAFAVLSYFTSAVLVDVAERGDRFDYIVMENSVRYGIEISGSQTAERSLLRDRHTQKIRQLLDNPQRWGGYVAVVGFTRREVILSYHEAREAQSL